MSLIQSVRDQVRGSVMPRTVIGPLLPASAAAAAVTELMTIPGRNPAARASPRAAPVPTPTRRPVSGPSPAMRFARSSSVPGIVTPVAAASFFTVASGVLLAARARQTMSR